MTSRICRRGGGLVLNVALGLAGLLLVSQSALAESDHNGDRSSVAGDITIQKGDTARNVACVACSVYVHGQVDGNIAVVMGDVIVDGTVDGKVAVALGSLKVNQGGVVQGDTAIALGSTDVNGGSLEGRHVDAPTGPIVAVLMFPLVVIVLVIWFIVWLVRRNRMPRYPYPPPPPPPGLR